MLFNVYMNIHITYNNIWMLYSYSLYTDIKKKANVEIQQILYIGFDAHVRQRTSSLL